MNPTVPVNESYSPSEWYSSDGSVVQVTPSAVPPELYYRYSNDTHDAAGRWEDSISQRQQNPSDTSVQQPASDLGIATLYLLVPTVAGSLLKTKTNK